MTRAEIFEQAELLMLQYTSLHRMRNTHERNLILKLIAYHRGSFTANDVISWVRTEYISVATVYNTLRLLENAHIVYRLHRQDAAREMEYELTLNDHSSMTIICSKCGRRQRVKDKATDLALDRKIYPNFIMHHYSVYLFGECRRCGSKMAMSDTNELL